jgi:nucleolar protein 4
MTGVIKRRKLSNGNYEAVKTAEVAEAEEGIAKGREQRRSLFVRSLAPSVTTKRLTEYFSQSYPLKHATVVLDPETKLSRGFGFVTFADAEDAQAAAVEFNDSKLDGKKIKVEVAESRNREDGQDGGRKKVNTKAVELRAQREKQREDAQPPRLIVRNLPWSIKEPEDLSLLFRSYGKVKHVVLPKKGPRAQSGFGFVVIRGKKNAEKAIEGVNGKEIDGRTLAVDWAVDKKTWEQLQDDEGNEDELLKARSKDEKSFATDPEDDDKDMDDEEGAALDDEAASETDEEEEEQQLMANDVLDNEEDKPEAEPDDEEDIKDSDSTTIFVRNVPFTATDETLQAHFTSFGTVRYARIVMDPETDRSRGTGFVAFYEPAIAMTCVKEAPKQIPPSVTGDDKDKKRRSETLTHSVLQNEANDPTGRYTLDGRVLQVTRALSKGDAAKRAEFASESRDKRDHDKRRVYLLSEGTVARGSKLYEQLGKAELDIREASAKQRQKLIKTNPNLCLSLTRLSVRNIPRSVDSKALKALAREAVVGFATDIKEGRRQPLNKEEKARGGQAMKEAERRRKEKKSGIVTQAKIVFEGREGVKVKEGAGAGRSRGYGFIEYVGHRNALMGLRWLNGRSVKGGAGDRNKRLIVEFAIENAQVVQRRGEREERAREWKDRAEEIDKSAPAEARMPRGKTGRFGKALERKAQGKAQQRGRRDDWNKSSKRKREEKDGVAVKLQGKSKKTPEVTTPVDAEEKNKIAKRNRIIAKKRGARQARKK